MRKKCGAWIAALALAVSLLAPMALAAGVTLAIKAPAAIPKAGETFEVMVDVSGNPGLCAIQFTLAYDEGSLECVQASLSKEFSGTISAANADTPDGAIVATASAEPMTGDGTLATFWFTAKTDVTSYGFALREVVLTDAARSAVSYTVEDAAMGKPADDPTPTVTPTPDPASPVGQAAAEAAPKTGTETAPKSVTFPDVAGHWGAEWIGRAAALGLFSGDDHGNFLPDMPISRGDYVLVLWRMASKPEPKSLTAFPDVPADAYYAKAVAWAYEQGYVNGNGTGFAPKNSLTRQEAMKILFGIAGSRAGMETMFTASYDATFTDSGSIADWAKPAMYWAYYEGIINGTSKTTLAPQATATRAQLAKILVGYLDRQA